MTLSQQIPSNPVLNPTTANQIDEFPAGGSDPERFDCKEAWYPIHYVADLDKSQPTPFTLLGQNLVIWWDRNGSTWRVFEDQCPHRLALLSEGRINSEGLLECPYHGWTFSGSGKCEFIPQQPENAQAEQSKRACVQGFPTAVCQGLLFAYAGNPENAAKVKVPIIEPLEETPDEWVCMDTFRDLPYDALTVLENVLDPSHVPYTHHGTVGNRKNASKVELEVVESGKQGFVGFWAEGPRKGTLGSQHTVFMAPSLMWHDLTSKQFGRTLTVVYATPMSKGKCRLFARFPFKFASKVPGLFIKLTPRWYSHLGQNTILEDDQIFLHYQERFLEAQGGSERFAQAFYLPTKADAFVFALRQWVNQYQGEPFPNVTLSPPLSKTELLDRYHSHTVNCKSCSRALANIQRLRMALAIIAAITWILSPVLAVGLKTFTLLAVILCSGISLLCGTIWLSLGRLEKRFYHGSPLPSRNQPQNE